MKTRTLALAVGINQFPNLSGSNLLGCCADASQMAQFFEEKFENVFCQQYVDQMATKSRIIKALTSMVNTAQQDRTVSRLMFSMSSHGSQVMDIDGDEPDGVDECVICYDTVLRGRGLDRSTVITDDEFFNLFKQVPERVLVEVFLDTCHSGTGLRKVMFDKNKPWVEKHNVPRYYRNPEIDVTRSTQKDRDLPPNVVLWSGCKANQYSNDVWIDGGSHGAMTYGFNAVFGEKKRRAEIHKDLLKFMAANDWDQAPQLECAAGWKQKGMVKV